MITYIFNMYNDISQINQSLEDGQRQAAFSSSI